MSENRKKIHQHLQRVTHLNTLLAIVALVGIGLIYVWMFFFQPETDTNLPEGTSETAAAATVSPEQLSALESNYKAALNATVNDFAFDNAEQAQTVLDTVLELRVPSTLQQVHLQVVVALNDAVEGDFTSAQERVNTIREEQSWFE